MDAAPPTRLNDLSSGDRNRPNARAIGTRSTARRHHGDADEYHRDRDHLRDAQAEGPSEAIILGPEKLDDETLNPGQHRPHAEQPSLGVVVIAHAPENREHDEAE